MPESSPRTAGILLHPTSLPGKQGIGTLGRASDRFIEALTRMHQSWWQMLPIGPTGYGDSPYQSPSTFAGNPLLVDLEMLADDGWLERAEVGPKAPLPDNEVDFGVVIPFVMGRLERATDRLVANPTPEFEEFCQDHAEVWLDDFAMFTALKRTHHLRPWWEWESPFVHRYPPALAEAQDRLSTQIARVKAEQFFFDRQFRRLRDLAHSEGVRLIGDIPIFVAHDSADVWANPDLFFLDESGHPTVVAGVPPDYFSETGQRWGNPLYDWDRHRSTHYEWWTARMSRVFDMFDLVRVDHFRGFDASWHIPADCPTAVDGEWVEAPGIELFDQLLTAFGDLPVIAEDLGVITPDVEALRDRYGFPGMKILQFGFGTESAHAPDQFRPNVVAYTGTHDNDTAVGWFEDPRPERASERKLALETLDSDGTGFAWDLIAAVLESVADTAIVPLQDVLGLGTQARMNTPATTEGNWRWRFRWSQLTDATIDRMRDLTVSAGR